MPYIFIYLKVCHNPLISDSLFRIMPSKKDELERWLESVVGKEGICFTEKFKFYAPTCYGKCEDAVDELQTRINKIFGGSTSYSAEGCWFNPTKGEMECEPIKVIEVAHHCTDRKTAEELVKAIRDYTRKAKQEAISISQGSFYILPSKVILEDLETVKIVR